MEASNSSPERREPWTPDLLVEFFRGQFAAAVKDIEEKESKHLPLSENGTPIQYVDFESRFTTLKGSYSIVIKDPHPLDRPGTFTEVFAIGLGGYGKNDIDRRRTIYAENFIVLDAEEGREDKWYIVGIDNDAEEMPDPDSDSFWDETEADPHHVTQMLGEKCSRRSYVTVTNVRESE